MIFNPYVEHKIVSFPQFSIAGNNLSFVPTLKYLGHIIDKSYRMMQMFAENWNACSRILILWYVDSLSAGLM